MAFSHYDVVGVTGVALIVISYLLLQLRVMDVKEAKYSILNALGASFILYSLTVDFNLSAFIIEIFWLLISLFGIFQSFRNGKLQH